MKYFKLADGLISTGLLAWYAIHWPDSIDHFINACLIVGGWQAFSQVVHEIKKWFTIRYNVRYCYHRLSFILLITIPLGSIWILGALAPFMAVFYTFLCTVEFFRIRKRPLQLV
jgi:hypothetical protein